jgi:hypothetical protein
MLGQLTQGFDEWRKQTKKSFDNIQKSQHIREDELMLHRLLDCKARNAALLTEAVLGVEAVPIVTSMHLPHEVKGRKE